MHPKSYELRHKDTPKRPLNCWNSQRPPRALSTSVARPSRPPNARAVWVGEGSRPSSVFLRPTFWLSAGKGAMNPSSRILHIVFFTYFPNNIVVSMLCFLPFFRTIEQPASPKHCISLYTPKFVVHNWSVYQNVAAVNTWIPEGYFHTLLLLSLYSNKIMH